MTKFLYHEPCPQCGSKNNLGVWDDGHKWCFGCKYYEFAPNNAHRAHKPQQVATYNPKAFPEDADSYIPTEPLRWLLGCGLTYGAEIERESANGKWYSLNSIKEHGIKWSPSQQLVCWRIFGISGKELGWQGRCFKKDAKTKYINQGKIKEDICVLSCPNSNTFVLCEDYISAIRISQFANAVPLFGCSISMENLLKIQNIHEKT